MSQEIESDGISSQGYLDCDLLRVFSGYDSQEQGSLYDLDSSCFRYHRDDSEGDKSSGESTYGPTFRSAGIPIDGCGDRERTDDSSSMSGSICGSMGSDRGDGQCRKRSNEYTDLCRAKVNGTRGRDIQETTSQGNGKHWVFTLNNYTPEELAELRRRVGDFRYICFQGEIGESGTKHLQGMCSFDRKLRIGQVKDMLGTSRVHLAIRRGTAEQARDYCKKQETSDSSVPFEEHGTFEKGQGRRSDLLEVVTLVRGGKKESDVIESCPEQYIKFHRGIRALIYAAGKPRDFKTIVHWYYGPTGTGKSRQAAERGAPNPYWKNGDDFWWDGYEGQEVVIIDDYRAGMCQFNMLLRLFDRYPLQVPFKGGFVKFVAKHIYVTTPYDVKTTWHNRTEEDIKQLIRRIEDVTFFPFKH